MARERDLRLLRIVEAGDCQEQEGGPWARRLEWDAEDRRPLRSL